MQMIHGVLEFVNGSGVGNPGPKPPPGVATKANDIISYVKWAVLLVIVLVGLVGAGAVAGGRIFSHHGSSKAGQGMIVSAVIAAVLYAGIYTFITSITGK